MDALEHRVQLDTCLNICCIPPRSGERTRAVRCTFHGIQYM